MFIWPGSGNISSLATLVLKIGHIWGIGSQVQLVTKRPIETCVELDLWTIVDGG